MTNMRKTMVEDFNKTCASLEDITCLPEQGLTQDEVLNKVNSSIVLSNYYLMEKFSMFVSSNCYGLIILVMETELKRR